MALLNSGELEKALAEIQGWAHEGDMLLRSYTFHGFAQALEFVNRVGALAEAADHHPDIDIRYNRVKLALTSHDERGITSRDVKLARQISQLQTS